MTNSNKLLSSLVLSAGFIGAVASANAAVISVDFSTGTPNANTQAWGSSLTRLGTNAGGDSRYVQSSAFEVMVGDTIDGSGTWFQNANNGSATATLWLGLFNSLMTNAAPLLSAATTCAANNATACFTDLPTYTATAAGQYYLVYFSNAGNPGDAFKTGSNGSTTVTNPPPSDVPVPASVALLGLGLIGIGAARRKQA